MKKRTMTALLLIASLVVFGQEKMSSSATTANWKVRLRAIAVIPTSNSYNLAESDVKISTSVVPELDFSYFFTENLAAELILGTTPHNVKLKTGSVSTPLSRVWLLPPTLNLQYHLPLNGVTPYIGAGVNYTIFYGVKDKNAELSYKNKAGISTQAGLDFRLNDKWFINLDVKKIFLKTDVTVKGSPSVVLNDVKINPLIIGLGIGTRF